MSTNQGHSGDSGCGAHGTLNDPRLILLKDSYPFVALTFFHLIARRIMTSHTTIAVAAILLGLGSYLGYRRGYYGRSGFSVILIVLMVFLVALFTGHIHLAY
jgi:hypothetical protein